MRRVIITRGLPASGKSTWSKQFVLNNPTFRRISRDDLRFMIWDGEFSEQSEKSVILARNALLERFLLAGYDVVLDETFLSPFRVREITELTKMWEVEVEIQDFLDVPLEVCLERNSHRGKNRLVPEHFIREYYEKYVKKLIAERDGK